MSVGERLRRILSKEPTAEIVGELTPTQQVTLVAFKELHVGSRIQVYLESTRVSSINHLPEENPGEVWKAAEVLEGRGFLQSMHDGFGWRVTKRGGVVVKALLKQGNLRVLE